MGQAVLSFPQFQDLEPDKAVKLFSDSFDLKIEWSSSEEWKRAQTSRPSRPRAFISIFHNVAFLHELESMLQKELRLEFRLIVTKFLLKILWR